MANKIKASNIDTNAITADSISYPLTTFSSTGIDDNATSTAITIDSSENVGIGETSPLGLVHIKSADSGISSVSGGANEFVIEGSGDTGMCIVGGTSNSAQILFGDGDSSFRGAINYDNTDDSLRLTTSASERMRIDSSGKVGIGTTSPSTPLQVNGVARASNFNTLSTQLVMNNSSQDWDISSVTGTVPNVEGSISFELTMRERSTTTNQLFRIFYIRVGPGTTFDISSAVWSVGSSAATTTISYPSAGTIRFTNTSFSVLDAQIRRINS